MKFVVGIMVFIGVIIILGGLPALMNGIKDFRTDTITDEFIVSTGLAADATLEKTTHVIIERVRVASATNMTLTIDSSTWGGMAALVTRIHNANSKAYLELYESWTAASGFNAIFDNTTLRSELVTNLSDLVTTYSLDGIDLDWEADVQSSLNITNFSNFIMELKTELGDGKGVLYAAPYNKMPFTLEASNFLELINVMAYDIAPPPWYGSYARATGIMEWWASQGVPKSKLTMGISFAGRDGTGSGWYHYHDIINTYNPPTSANSVTNTSIAGGVINYNGQDLVKQKAQWIKDNGYGGCMVYTLALDIYGGHSKGLLYGIYDIFQDTIISNPTSAAINSVYIWRNVLQTNDYIAVALEDVDYPTNPNLDISQTFLFRYMSNNLSTDYGDIQAYPYYNDGYDKGVVSFYFPAASNMTWQGQYQIQIQGKVSAFTDPPVYNFAVAASSYYSGANTTTAIRSDMTTKILSLADTLDTAWGDNYTLTTNYDTRRVFSSQGEAYFRMAIPGIQEMCPDLFLTAIGDPPADNTTWTQNESNEWSSTINGTAFGQQGIQTLADLFSVSFLTFAAIPVLAVCGVLLLVGAMTGSVLSGLMNSSLVIVASSYYGWFPPIAMVIVAFGAAVYSLWHFFGKHGG